MLYLPDIIARFLCEINVKFIYGKNKIIPIYQKLKNIWNFPHFLPFIQRNAGMLPEFSGVQWRENRTNISGL